MEVDLKLVPRIKLGARVRIKPGSRFYQGGPKSSNPRDIDGSICEGASSWLSVRWDNGLKNNYEEDDLIFEEANDMIEVDVNKLYFKQRNIEIINMQDLLSALYPNEMNGHAIGTYYMINGTDELSIQCQPNRMRSFDDILFLANNYLPDLEVKDVMAGLLLFNVTPELIEKNQLPKSFSNCSTMRRIRFTNSWHNFDNVLYSIDCNKYDSKYSWRELFNMLNIKTINDLRAWYVEQLKTEVKQV